MRAILQDIRFAFRMLAKRPGTTTVIIVTLALGIGANVAVFSVVDAVLVKPMPVADPEGLVRLWATNTQPSSEGVCAVSAVNCMDWRDQSEKLDDLAVFQEDEYDLTGGDQAEKVGVVRATANLLPMLGVEASLGRLHTSSDDTSGAQRVAVLMDGLWQRSFGGIPDAIGQTIVLNGEPYTIIGVLPADLDRAWGTEGIDVWVPLCIDLSSTSRSSRSYESIARLKAGATLQEAQTEMNTIAARLATAYPNSNADRGVWVQPFSESMVSRETRIALKVLLAAVGFVLMIACANIANLLLVQSASRKKELSIRVAVGACRMRIARQLFTENAILAVVGGSCGLLVGMWMVGLLAVLLAGFLTHPEEIHVNGRVLAYSLAASCGAALLFGLYPAFSRANSSLGEAIKVGVGRTTSGPSRSRMQSGLIVSEVSLALLLVVCTGLMAKSLLALRSVELGFDPTGLLTMQIDLPAQRYAKSSQRAGFLDSACEAIAALPGVEVAGAVSELPLGGDVRATYITIEGRAPDESGHRDITNLVAATPGYFEAMKIRLLGGRLIQVSDVRDSAVAVINKAMADKFWPNDDAVGKRLRMGSVKKPGPWRTVVGVVDNVRHVHIKGQPEWQMFLPYTQWSPSSMALIVRTVDTPMTMVASVRDVLRRLDPDQPAYRIRPMIDVVSNYTVRSRVCTGLMGALAAIALLLASVGLYGIMSYGVSQRTREIGIRMALGAARVTVLRFVLKRCLVLCLLGILVGLPLSMLATRTLTSLLYEVSPVDPTTYIGVSMLLLSVSLLAGYLPARRATKVDPMVALRCE